MFKISHHLDGFHVWFARWNHCKQATLLVRLYNWRFCPKCCMVHSNSLMFQPANHVFPPNPSLLQAFLLVLSTWTPPWDTVTPCHPRRNGGHSELISVPKKTHNLWLNFSSRYAIQTFNPMKNLHQKMTQPTWHLKLDSWNTSFVLRMPQLGGWELYVSVSDIICIGFWRCNWTPCFILISRCFTGPGASPRLEFGRHLLAILHSFLRLGVIFTAPWRWKGLEDFFCCLMVVVLQGLCLNSSDSHGVISMNERSRCFLGTQMPFFFWKKNKAAST